MKKEWNAAIAANASAAGLVSGRMVVVFYAQTQKASWLGVITASILFGVLCGCVCILAKKTGAESLAEAGMSLFGMRFGMLIGVLCSLAAVVVAVVMLSESGRMAALALPVRHAWEMGVLFALVIALLLNMNGMRGLHIFGASAIVICVLFHAGLGLDNRPVLFRQRFETVAKLSGSGSAALLLACLHASLCALIATDVVMRRARDIKDNVIFLLNCALIMLTMLFAANSAMLRGGTRLLSLEYPAAALAARWGKVGYYLCIFSIAMQNIATLSACMGAIIGLHAKHDKIPC